jgi:hypothetical protein
MKNSEERYNILILKRNQSLRCLIPIFVLLPKALEVDRDNVGRTLNLTKTTKIPCRVQLFNLYSMKNPPKGKGCVDLHLKLRERSQPISKHKIYSSRIFSYIGQHGLELG